jgi:hypothetical protein
VKVRICKEDCLLRTPRWKKGEIGEVLENDSQKYDFKVKLEGIIPLEDFLGSGKTCNAVRVFYFYKDEVEEVP